MKSHKILIIDGPNLNLTGIREPEHYGDKSIKSLNKIWEELYDLYPGLEIEHYQSNNEGDIVSAIQRVSTSDHKGIVINPGGFTHTSIAISDAIRASQKSVIEIHISNIYSREEFRKHSLTAPVCNGTISGFGIEGYRLAVEYLLREMR